jgi:hypothetical protein
MGGPTEYRTTVTAMLFKDILYRIPWDNMIL